MSSANTSSGLLNRVASPFVVFVERYYPDPFVFVIALTLVTFVVAFGLTDVSVEGALTAWGGGMSALMAFTAQLGITLITAHAFAHTDLVQRVLRAIARLPGREGQAYAMIAAAAGAASLLAWPLGLVVGATLAKRVAVEGARRGLTLDYPLLVASAYSGFVVWHMGYSGSAPLFVATPGHALEAQIGVVPVTATIFSTWNLIIAAVTLTVVSLSCPLMRPAPARARPIDVEALSDIDEEEPSTETFEKSVGDKAAELRIGSLLLGGLLFGYLAIWFTEQGFSLNLNIVNWTLLAFGLILARSPAHYVALALEGGRSLGALLLQYPFYAGIMGLLAGAGLVDLFSVWVAEQSNATTLPIWAFLSGGLVNLFVPSGGGQWAVQGPIFIEAARALEVDPALIVMAVAYGDQWTNMIQPFWTIPLLALAGLKVRDVLGYTFVTLIVTLAVFTLGLLVAGAMVG